MDIKAHYEAIAAMLIASPPSGMSAAQAQALVTRERPRVLAEIIRSARGHAFQIAGDWYVDSGLLAAAAAGDELLARRNGYDVGLGEAVVRLDRVAAAQCVPGQRGCLYHCEGPEAEVAALVRRWTDAGHGVAMPGLSAWPKSQPRPAAPASACGGTCACRKCQEGSEDA